MSGKSTTSIPGGALNSGQVHCYSNCPHQWWLRFKEGIKLVATPPLILGGVCHKVFEAIRIDQAKKKLRDYLSQYKGLVSKSTLRKKEVGQGEQMIIAFYEWVEANKTPVYTYKGKPAQELELKWKHLRGTFDTIVDGDDGPIIEDYKTSIKLWTPEDYLYRGQGWLYLLLARQRGIPVKGFRYVIITKIPPSLVFTYEIWPIGSELEKWAASFEAIYDAMKKGVHPRIIAKRCERCDVAEHCRKGI